MECAPSDGADPVDAALARFGLPAGLIDRPHIAAALDAQVRLEEEGRGDQFLMRVLCAQLFSLGQVADALLVWRAKQCNFDTHCAIDVQLLCGAGLDATKAFLKGSASDGATHALEYLRHCEACGNFAGFTVEQKMDELRQFYRVGAGE